MVSSNGYEMPDHSPEKKVTPFLFLRLDRYKMVHFSKKMVKLLCKEFTFSANINLNCYNLLFQEYKDSNQRFLLKHKFKVHNQFLDYLLKFGYLGAILLIIFFTNKFIIALKIRSAVFLYFCVLFLAANLFDDLLRIYDVIAFCAFWTSVFIKRYLEQRNQ